MKKTIALLSPVLVLAACAGSGPATEDGYKEKYTRTGTNISERDRAGMSAQPARRIMLLIGQHDTQRCQILHPAELAHQPGKQRRQHQVIKMRRAVCEPDEADNFGIVPKGGGSGGSAHRDCGRKAIYCIRHVRYLAARSAASRPAHYLS